MFKIPRRYAEEIIDHAREVAPNECCGILAGKEGRALQLYRAVNAEQSRYRYDIDSQDLYRISTEVEARGWEFLAIYHSHPKSEAYPSPTDVSRSQLPGAEKTVDAWPNVYHLIVSLADPRSPLIRAFRIEEGRITEEPLQAID
ncbi:MAG: M67 family metallopeptidase [Dehalococcoidia bacterium]|nr:M67 family metallopeptidase [Dehalococcoidia bacterium]